MQYGTVEIVFLNLGAHKYNQDLGKDYIWKKTYNTFVYYGEPVPDEVGV